MRGVIMEIKILGTGCAKCAMLKQTVAGVVREMGIDANVLEVRDLKKIMEYPVLTTPGLVLDGKLVVSGRVPDKAEVVRLIANALEKGHKQVP
jgi:small redox-active disulfide protein 2